MSPGAHIVQTILLTCLGAPLAALIGALLVQLIMRVLFKFTPRYWMTWRAVTVGFILSVVLGFICGYLMAPPDGQMSVASSIFFMSGGFFLGSAVMAVMIVHPESGPIGFWKACATNFCYSVIMISFIVSFPVAGYLLKKANDAQLPRDAVQRSGGTP